jgi:Tubulin/FtsZ family, GTPase domain
MTSVILQIGQCGNQIGFQLWKLLKDEVSIRDNTVFSRNSERARCIMVDSEPKVVEKPFKKTSHPLHDFLSQSLALKSNKGRGNNWAMGYADSPENIGKDIAYASNSEKNQPLAVQTMEMLRKEIEACDYYKGCVLLHSLAGGTGSGLGSRLLELIRDEYPICFITAASIFPSDSGDTPVQDYNSCLCLNYLQNYADSIIYFENDEIMKQVQQFSKRGSNISTHNLNEYIAFSLSNLLLPKRTGDLDFSGLYQDLVPSYQYKFIETKSSPFIIDKQATFPREITWTSLLESSLKNFVRANEDISHLTLCAKACFRGDDVTNTFDKQPKKHYSKLSAVFKPVSWVDKNYLKLFYIPEKAMNSIYKIDRIVSLSSNRTSIVHPIKKLLTSAKAKFQVGAYLHWYNKYNCEENQFVEAFNCLDNIVSDYQYSLRINPGL